MRGERRAEKGGDVGGKRRCQRNRGCRHQLEPTAPPGPVPGLPAVLVPASPPPCPCHGSSEKNAPTRQTWLTSLLSLAHLQSAADSARSTACFSRTSRNKRFSGDGSSKCSCER